MSKRSLWHYHPCTMTWLEVTSDNITMRWLMTSLMITLWCRDDDAIGTICSPSHDLTKKPCDFVSLIIRKGNFLIFCKRKEYFIGPFWGYGRGCGFFFRCLNSPGTRRKQPTCVPSTNFHWVPPGNVIEPPWPIVVTSRPLNPSGHHVFLLLAINLEVLRVICTYNIGHYWWIQPEACSLKF